jgi:hypothetical protein
VNTHIIIAPSGMKRAKTSGAIAACAILVLWNSGGTEAEAVDAEQSLVQHEET